MVAPVDLVRKRKAAVLEELTDLPKPVIKEILAEKPELGGLLPFHTEKKERGIPLEKAALEEAPKPGAPVDRNMSILPGWGKSQPVVEADKEVLVGGSDGIEKGDLSAGKASVQNIYSEGGATGNASEQQRMTLRDNVIQADPATIVESAKGGGNLSHFPGITGELTTTILPNVESDLFAKGNVVDATVELESAAATVDFAVDRFQKALDTLAKANVSEHDEAKIMDVIEKLTGSDSFKGFKPEDMVLAGLVVRDRIKKETEKEPELTDIFNAAKNEALSSGRKPNFDEAADMAKLIKWMEESFFIQSRQK